jgi:hypothetical protein
VRMTQPTCSASTRTSHQPPDARLLPAGHTGKPQGQATAHRPLVG